MATRAAPVIDRDLAQAWLRRYWLLAAGLVAVIIPSLIGMGRESWSSEAGVHGPLVLATAIWLITQRLPEIRRDARPGSALLTALGMAVAVAGYAFGRAFGFLSVEVFCLLLGLLSAAYAYVGAAVLRRLWFPILYLAFIIPLPGWLIDSFTQPLKLIVSEVVTGGLEAAGLPIVRIGVTLYVAQYQLLVEDACAGLNSIISLTAMTLFYIYLLHNASWRYALLLMTLILPVAIIANIIRVAALVLITYFLGDEAAQGYLHNFAGIVTFVSALLTMFLLDSLLSPLRRWLTPAAGETPR